MTSNWATNGYQPALSDSEQLNRAIATFIGERPGRQLEELYDAFGPGPANPTNLKAFRRRLARLVTRGWLATSLVGDDRTTWSLGKAAPESVGGPKASQIAAPRQIDVLRGAVYQPPAASPTRPGALHFKTLASRGLNC